MTRLLVVAAVALVAACGGYLVGEAEEGPGVETMPEVAAVGTPLSVTFLPLWALDGVVTVSLDGDDRNCVISTGQCDGDGLVTHEPYTVTPLEEPDAGNDSVDSGVDDSGAGSVPDDQPVPVMERPSSGARSYQDALRLLGAAGWPPELHDAAYDVFFCESRWQPDAANWGDQPDGLGSTGIAQLSSIWYRYAGYPWEQWSDPLVNLTVAWAVYQYDIERGNPPFWQWSCRRVLQ